MHVLVFGILFAVLASPKTISFVQNLLPSVRLSEAGTQLTHTGLLVHGVVFMALALLFAYYQARPTIY